MKKTWVLVALGTLMASGMAMGEEMDGGKRIALLPVGDIDATLVERLRKFADTNLMMPVVTVAAEDIEAKDFDGVGEAAAKSLEPQDAFGVVVYMPTEEMEGHGVLLKQHNVALVNARAMMPGTEGDRERYARRMERQVLRAIGMQLDLPNSPNPQSAMWPYKTLDQLDRIGRNFDPPWLLKAQRAAKERGITVKDYEWLQLQEIKDAAAARDAEE